MELKYKKDRERSKRKRGGFNISVDKLDEIRVNLKNEKTECQISRR